ncbi:type II secretion system protein [Candidatus Saccharibacteria bacterium]|nr:type II secretion system protein [Candidatus Saccharibacteria bacterium]MBR2708959.1 type II secretion system protein [Candidatus Saccharibacteria bacterium]
MAKDNIKTKQGFTIIEVVLVLAIAGLIFLMVFVALPALQRSQRDSARRNDMSRVDTSLTQYQTNHNSNPASNLPGNTASSTWTGAKGTVNCTGNNATEACLFVRDYMNSGSGDVTENEFIDPDGEAYSVAISKNVSAGLNDFATVTAEGWVSQLINDTAKGGLTIADAQNGNAFDQHAVYIIPGARCQDDVAVSSTARHFAVLYRLEGAGIYCIDDQ